MPRKTKEVLEEEKNRKKPVADGKKVTKTKTSAISAASKTKKSAAKEKKETPPSSTTKKATVKTTKKTTSTKTKKVEKQKAKTVEKKTPAKKTTVTKKTTTKASVKAIKKAVPAPTEYYDLPFRYNETVVRVLAQTPKSLFVYWDISDSDRERFMNDFSESFFYETYPVLVVTNITKKYRFEVVIDDFANNWYIPISDDKCEYTVELGRRSKNIQNYVIPNNYLPITSSNLVEAPNGRILIDSLNKTIYFRNVKTNKTTSKDLANMAFMQRAGRIYDVYKKMYHDIELDDYLNNPSSHNPTSTFQ